MGRSMEMRRSRSSWTGGRRLRAVLMAAAGLVALAGGPVAMAPAASADPGVCEGDGWRGIVGLVAADDLVFFGVEDEHGGHLWRSDGSVAGTIPLRSGMVPSRAWTGPAGRAGGAYLLIEDDGVHGPELWRSDGAATGTRPLHDFQPGLVTTALAPLGPAGDRLMLLAADDGVHGTELWRTDGTRDGTVMVGDLRPGQKGSAPGSAVPLGRSLLFVADDGVHGAELWRSDGWHAGTRLVKDLRPGAGAGSHPRRLTALDGVVVFVADRDAHRAAIWRTDGTPSGTRLIGDLGAGTQGTRPTILGRLADGSLVMVVRGDRGAVLWRTDGSRGGTGAVVTLPAPGQPGGLAPSSAGGVLFAWQDADHGVELWATDGTAAGTGLVRDILPGPESSRPWGFTDLGGRSLFLASDLSVTDEDWSDVLRPWRSDGTSEGTVLAAAAEATEPGGMGAGTCWPPSEPVLAAGLGWFAATDGIRGAELWHSDGTVAGTAIEDLVPGEAGLAPADLTAVGDLLFFTAQDGSELWRTDGTPAGTVRLLRLPIG